MQQSCIQPITHEKTKIYNVLAHFNKYEQNRLRKFLISPYFNSDESIVLLFDLLVKYLNGNQKKELSKKTLWSKLIGEREYEDLRFRKYCSDLLKIVESFLAIESVENDKITKSYLTLNAIKDRKVEGLYKSFIRNSQNLAETNPDNSSSFFLNKFLVEKTLYELTASELKRLETSNIESISKNLDYFYFSEKLKYFVAAEYQKRVLRKEYKINFIDHIRSEILNEDYLEIPAIAFYYYSLLTIEENEIIEHYDKLKELLSNHAHKFPKSEALNLYYSAANYCIKKINSGESSFYEELFSVFQEMVNTKTIVSEQGEVSPWSFKNIVANGLFLKKYDWTEKFIDDYGKLIPIQYRDNAIKFNLGQLYFREEKYEQALDQLRDLEYDDILASLHAKTYTIYCYYELDEVEFLLSFIESFRVYVGRKKEINKDRQERYLNFLSLVRKLTRIIPRDKKAIERFERDLTENKKQGVVGAKWLSEKIEELK